MSEEASAFPDKQQQVNEDVASAIPTQEPAPQTSETAQHTEEIDAISNMFNQMSVKTSVPLIDFILKPGTALHPSVSNVMYIVFLAIAATAGVLQFFGFINMWAILGLLVIAACLFISWQWVRVKVQPQIEQLEQQLRDQNKKTK